MADGGGDQLQAALLTLAIGMATLGSYPGATPVTAVYDKDGKPRLYVWGAEGKLAESAGPLGDYLQCQTSFRCAPGPTTAASSW